MALIRQAMAMLESAGVTRLLCHPSSSDYEPHIPRCDTTCSHSRHLEDGDEYGRDDDDYFNDDRYNRHDRAEEDYSIAEDYFTGADEEYPYYYLIRNGILAFVCVVIAGIQNGLLMGVMSLDPVILEVKAKTAPSSIERKQANTLLSFVNRKNLIMTSIIIVNTAMNEALPVFLDRLVPTYISIVLSTTLLVLVGEILPTAFFTSGNQISAVYKLLPILRGTIFVTLCVSYPLSRLIDTYLHDGGNDEGGEQFHRDEISAFVRIKHERIRKEERIRHQKITQSASSTFISIPETPDKTLPELLMPEDGIDAFNLCSKSTVSHQSDIVPGSLSARRVPNLDHVDADDVENIDRVLSFREKLVIDCFTPLHRVFAVAADTIVNDDLILKVYNNDYSRVPVFDGTQSNICGVLLAKHLMVVDKTAGRRVSTMPLSRPPCVGPHTTLTSVMSIFRQGTSNSSQLAIVCTHPKVADVALDRGELIPVDAGILGIITFEDVISKAVGQVIEDEKDRRSRAPMQRVSWAAGKWKAFVLRQRILRMESEIANSSAETMISHRTMYSSSVQMTSSHRYRSMLDDDGAYSPPQPQQVPLHHVQRTRTTLPDIV
eukprot:CAMPEP_0201867890 /NCGR_PEP_ID=MMETSP0902-20130614/1983_1 /ASSEMBLY_ACC=CAM_ASM_000551 /TAXON_ID=420261 /ORGANISM="Thalassiosira antarctica, Strain CCMP982" /LENGTH=602 /DNA_ID=CAMNT_0048393151 /DNA_START=101 /DNA_END=1909 /DNA_ORIENTATION=-